METPLKRARLNRGVTLAEVARAIDSDTGNLSRIENGKQSASTKLAEQLSNYFDRSVTEIEILYPERFEQAPKAAA
jgi:transcriptional regulator with XRE-family HTH domain